ncbi:TPA: HTH domain-containing protein [Streptococcus suis]|nr:HTH domain-containing protein [Streptococcus suis]
MKNSSYNEKNKQSITALELSKLLFVSISTIERDLKKLTDEKVIEYIGSAKDGYWIVKKEINNNN